MEQELKRSCADRGGEGAGEECGEEERECEWEERGEEWRDVVGLSVGVMGGEDSDVEVDDRWRCRACPCPSIDWVSSMAGGGRGGGRKGRREQGRGGQR